MSKVCKIVANVCKCTDNHHIVSCAVAEIADICVSKYIPEKLSFLDELLDINSVKFQGKEYIADIVDYIIDNFPNIDISGPISIFFNDVEYKFSERETLFISNLIKMKYNTLSVYTQIERNIELLNQTKKFNATKVDNMLKIELTDFEPKKLYKSTTICPLPAPVQPISVVGGCNNYCVMIPIYSTGHGMQCTLL